MKYAVEMGTGVMIYIPSFTKIGSAIQKLMGGGHSQTQTAWRWRKPTLIFQNNECRLIKFELSGDKSVPQPRSCI
jgi:hypothetical protein